MFKRLAVLLLVVAATLSLTTPARATALTIHAVSCFYAPYYFYDIYQPGFYCSANVSGGTGNYVSYTWDIESRYGNYSYTTTTYAVQRPCVYDEYVSGYLTVTDSLGATTSQWIGQVYCGNL
ncbi:MAG: hypothetical protein JOZ51_14220 [Chloroflexi bacterium]|nr:hypothetical protein [Chloroflexota bacterium]